MRITKLSIFAISLLIGSVIGIGGCATSHTEPVKTDRQEKSIEGLDQDKVFKKGEENDDMERLD